MLHTTLQPSPFVDAGISYTLQFEAEEKASFPFLPFHKLQASLRQSALPQVWLLL